MVLIGSEQSSLQWTRAKVIPVGALSAMLLTRSVHDLIVVMYFENMKCGFYCDIKEKGNQASVL